MSPHSKKDPIIEALDLEPTAREAAYALKKAHPGVVFTSGRRTLAKQASAMAANVVKERKYIEKTYKSSVASKACQKWVDDHPEAVTAAVIAAGLEATLDKLTEEERLELSRHLSGKAFDVNPVADGADAIKKTIRDLKGLTKFLEKEAGLEIWHAEF